VAGKRVAVVRPRVRAMVRRVVVIFIVCCVRVKVLKKYSFQRLA